MEKEKWKSLTKEKDVKITRSHFVFFFCKIDDLNNFHLHLLQFISRNHVTRHGVQAAQHILCVPAIY